MAPYNKLLTRQYDAHSNVEICSTEKAAKSAAPFSTGVRAQAGPLSGSALGRPSTKCPLKNFSAQEAAWRLLQFDMHGPSPHVERLRAHLEDDDVLYFGDAADLRDNGDGDPNEKRR